MSQNLISATLAQTLADEIVADIAAIRAKQTFLMTLSADAKSGIAKKGLGNSALCDLIRTAATESPGQLAADFPMAAWDEDRAFVRIYRPVVAAQQKLTSDMEDTLMAGDSDDWSHASEAYGDLKKDAVGPAIDEARATMRARHGSRTPAPTPPTP